MGIYIEGVLTADGTASDPILFTGEVQSYNGSWFGINYHNTNSIDNILDYVTVEYGGGYNPTFGLAANVSLTCNHTSFPGDLYYVL